MNNIIDLKILAAKLSHCENVRVFPDLNIVQSKSENDPNWKFMMANFNGPVNIDVADYDNDKQIITIKNKHSKSFTISSFTDVCALTHLSYASKNVHKLIMVQGTKEPVNIADAFCFIRMMGTTFYCDINFNILYTCPILGDKPIICIEKVDRTLSCSIINGYIVIPSDYIIDGNAVVVGGIRYYLIYLYGNLALFNETDEIYVPTLLEILVRNFDGSDIHKNVKIPDIHLYKSVFNYDFAYIGQTESGEFVELSPINIEPPLHTKNANMNTFQ